MVMFIALAALGIDIGSWDHAQRQVQSSIDSGALAGAQDLPAASGTVGVGNAQTTATNFITANTNGNPDANSLAPNPPTFPAPTGSGCSTDNSLTSTTANCIAIDGTRPTKGIFAKALSAVFGTVQVHAHSQAFVGPPGSVFNLSAAPLRVDQACGANLPPPLPPRPCPILGVTLNLDWNGDTSNSTVTLIDLDVHSTDQTIGSTNPGLTNVPTQIMSQWLSVGYNGQTCTPFAPATSCNGSLPVQQWYAIDTGSHNGLGNAFIVGKTILIPVYDAQYPALPAMPTAYHIIGFAAFKIASVQSWNNGANQGHKLTGDLVKFIATGLSAGPCLNCTNFGVFVVGLDG
jgi:hypothetical protein